ncbi:TetR family transcriptional regulator [Microtetraspora sp. NBRC 13810]|uniref:TetR/AcrR family transcriptional regulator n=1 Tax=Microtetraspora sp. NBRC 13810 TaxID=3030990 RepID=UPI0024A2E189|nr:TetR/AcrR family transcriptional regulator [Microtetraspora sp. NBRC 13810]GLW07047.1 TetR family transcriptional regulator [Microtetraspora sp. NBRC 13810]
MEPIWNRPERAARGPRPAHSRDAVAAAGVRVADTEGVEAVSMRRVAAEPGAGTASLYRYLTGKDELFDLMVDAVMRAEEPPERTGEWRADLRALAAGSRAVMLRHPWLPMLVAARPNLGPGSLRWMESWYGAVDGFGLDADEMLALVGTVQIFVHGAVTRELAEREAGFDFASRMAAQGAYGDAVIAGGAYPTLIRIMVEAEGPHRPDRHDRAFADGLERVLDGHRSLPGGTSGR